MRAASAECPVLVGQRHRHLGARRKRRDQVELVACQVVEPVEEDGSLAQNPSPASSRRDRLARDAVRVDQPEPVAQLGVAGEQGREVAEVGRALEGPGHRFDVCRLEPGRLQLVEQTLKRERKAGLGGRAAQRPQVCPPRGDRDCGDRAAGAAQG